LDIGAYLTMGTENVPEMAIMHCHGKTYGNVYVITFRV
jgi:hypothetical protein